MTITNITPVNSVSTGSGDAFTLLNGDVLGVFSGGYLLTSAAGFSGVYMNGGNSIATILGQVWGQNIGIFAQGATAWTKSITIGETGVVGAINSGIRADTGLGVVSLLELSNAGQILSTGTESSGGQRATIYSVNAGLDIVNSGTIGAHPGYDTSIYGTGSLTRFNLDNSGVVAGEVIVSSSATLSTLVRNTGRIAGDLEVSGGASSSGTVFNQGQIEGVILLGLSSATVDLTGGSASGLSWTGSYFLLTGRNADVGNNIVLRGTTVTALNVAGSHYGALSVEESLGSNLELNGVVIHKWLWGCAGIDTISLVGSTVYRDILVDRGNDLVDLTDGICHGRIDLGEGNDTFYGGDGDDVVSNSYGNDLVLLGGGNDIAQLSLSQVADSQRDTLDGGTGIDQISAAAASLYVSLEDGVASAGPLATAPLLGIAEISGFENVEGSSYDDVLIGNNLANVLLGSAGNDALQGREGSDVLRGGDGDELLLGQAGKDTLAGGIGIDRFIFTAPTESPPSGSRRDVIRDFQAGIDKIDLTAIDANPALAGNQAFAFGTQVTTEAVNGHTLVKVDISGSAAPELAIVLIGNLTLSAADFLL